MRRTLAATFFGVVTFYAVIANAEGFKLTIDQIVADGYIRGTVLGMQPQDSDKYCVAVYVHTDQWYIHPYAGGGEGKSWAKIGNGATWTIPTVKRDFPADSVAALILKKSGKECPAPAKVGNPAGVDNVGIEIKRLEGNDHGKL